MTIDLTGVRAKISRGWDHLHEFDAQVREWLRHYPYGIGQEVEADGREHTWSLDVFTEPDDAFLGILIGECAAAFRSALDHLVYALARESLSPVEFAKCEGGLAYPICTSESAWEQALAGHRLEGLSDPVIAEIERRQSYNASNTPEHTPLFLLRWLNDRDKHRLLHTFVAFVSPTELRFDPEVPAGTLFEHGTSPFENGAKILKITLAEPNPHMQMVMDMVVQVSVRDAPWTEDIRDLLGQSGQTVQRIVAQVAEAAGTTYAAAG